MTIDEKRNQIFDWCRNHIGCSDCRFLKDECDFEDDALVEMRYSELFPSGDVVNHPTHYQGKNECIDVMVAMFGVEAVKHFCMCNAYKYRFRADKKNGAEDIAKAEWYESKLIELGGADGESKTG